jgi:hypothetical protein
VCNAKNTTNRQTDARCFLREARQGDEGKGKGKAGRDRELDVIINLAAAAAQPLQHRRGRAAGLYEIASPSVIRVTLFAVRIEDIG